MVEWWKGELLIREKKISLLVTFCQCTISFGKQKLYVKSGFQFSLKNFTPTELIWNFASKSRVFNVKFTKQNIKEWKTITFLLMAGHDNISFQKTSVVLQKNNKMLEGLFINLSEVTKWRIRNLEFKKIINCKIIQFSNLYSNTLNFVSKVTLKANK